MGVKSALRAAGLVLAFPFLLTACFFSPGAFTSTLDIGRDRSFTFTYVGEVIVTDPGSQAGEGFAQGLSDAVAGQSPEALAEPSPRRPAEIGEARRQAIIEALTREAGYRSVDYVGDNKFRVDYSVSGRLDRNFVYPINLDAPSVIPWIAVEVRQDGTARMTAMAFGDPPGGTAGQPGADSANEQRRGTFTLTTDADLVMHNNEEGTAPGDRATVTWRITPTTQAAPRAVVRF